MWWTHILSIINQSIKISLSLSQGPSNAELAQYKQEIIDWKKMVREFGIENDPDIKQMEAMLDGIWDDLNLDQV